MLIRKNKIPIKQMILIGFWPSFVKKLIYKTKGFKIGKNVSFGIGSVIIGNKVAIGDNSSFGPVSVVRGNEIEIGRFVTIGMMTMIDTEKIVIGDDTRINENVIIGGIKRPESLFQIGKRGIVMEYSFINPTKPVIIGDDSGIGGHCLLFTHGSWLSQLDGFPVTFAPITLGDKVWLPWRVFIMPGVEIGNEVVIGANSLVAKSLPSNVLAAGSPAKILAEDYPKGLTAEQRDEIFQNILSDFFEHLQHNGFEVKEAQQGDNRLLLISNASRKSEILILNTEAEPTFTTSDNLVIIDADLKINSSQIMSIDLIDKTRIGTSDVGEEFVRFISRYGVRFNRLD